MFNDINKFVDKFVNNKLNEIKDTFISDNEIYQIIDKIKEIKKIDNDEIVQQLILDTSLCLPKMSMSIMSYYFHDQEILYQGLKNIYTNFIYKKYNNENIIDSFISCTFNFLYYTSIYINDTFDDIYSESIKNYSLNDYKKAYERKIDNSWKNDIFKKYYCKKFNFCIFSFSIRRWNKIFLYFYQLLIKMNYSQYKHKLYLEYLTLIFNRYIKNSFSKKEYKKIINIIAKSIIYIMKNQYYYIAPYKDLDMPHLKEKIGNSYIPIFDTIISQWDLVYSNYQFIIKSNINKWLNDLINKNYYLYNWQLLYNVIIEL